MFWNRKNIIWEIYIILYSGIVLRQVVLLFYPDSPTCFYFLLLRSFNQLFCITYALAIFQLFFDILFIIPLVGFTYQIKIPSLRLWQYLFFFKLIFQFQGNSYDSIQLVSLYRMDLISGIYATASGLIPHLPAYIAVGLYAFRSRKLLP